MIINDVIKDIKNLDLDDDIKEKLSDGNIGSELYERLVDKIIIYGAPAPPSTL